MASQRQEKLREGQRRANAEAQKIQAEDNVGALLEMVPVVVGFIRRATHKNEEKQQNRDLRQQSPHRVILAPRRVRFNTFRLRGGALGQPAFRERKTASRMPFKKGPDSSEENFLASSRASSMTADGGAVPARSS